MALQTLSPVRAARDIQRGSAVVVENGAPGRIVNLQTGWASTTYTVEFTPAAGRPVTLLGLTDGDVLPS